MIHNFVEHGIPFYLGTKFHFPMTVVVISLSMNRDIFIFKSHGKKNY